MYIEKNKNHGEYGYIEEFCSINSIIVDTKEEEKLNKYVIKTINESILKAIRPYADEEQYIKADVFDDYDTKIKGEYLILKQSHPVKENILYHINQDIRINKNNSISL